MASCFTRRLSARSNLLVPSEDAHRYYPRRNGADSVYHSAFAQRYERSVANRVKQVLENHPRNVVGGREDGPPNHAGAEHLQRLFPKARDGQQHEQREKAVRDCVALEGVSLQRRNSIGGDERPKHRNHEQRAGVQPTANRRVRNFRGARPAC